VIQKIENIKLLNQCQHSTLGRSTLLKNNCKSKCQDIQNQTPKQKANGSSEGYTTKIKKIT
jgi:hypothetical protein